MPRIFISYRREETAGYAGRLRDRLVQHFGADQVFMDVDTIELGVDFGEVIEQAVADVDVFLCVMGPEWATLTDEQGRLRLDNPTDFVRMEVASAIERDIRVIPVLVKNAVVPRPDQLPPALEALSRRNALQLTDTRFHADVDRLVAGIRKLVDAEALETNAATNETTLDVEIPAAEPPTTMVPPASTIGPRRESGWKWRIAIVLIILLAGGAGYGWHLYDQMQQRVAKEKAEVAKREALERRRAELQAEEESRARAQEKAELEAKRQAEKAAALEARRGEAQAEAARREAALEARRRAELEARAQARREAEAAERRRNEALKVRAKRMVEDIARLYASYKTADNCGVVRRIATTLERYFETHYPLPDDAVVTVRYPRRIVDPKVSDLARDRNLRIRRAKSECF